MRVDVGGEVRVRVEVDGEGPTVLLLHGYPDTHACWRHQVPALNAAGYRTVAPDLRGFGDSDKPVDVEDYEPAHHVDDLLRVLDHLDVDRVHVVGHDWGSVIGQLLTVTAPELVASLTCLSVGHPAALLTAGWEQRMRSWYVLLFQFPRIAELYLSANDFRNLRGALTDHPDAGEVVERMRDPRALTAGLNMYRAGFPPSTLLRTPSDLPSVPSPATMGVWSTRDRFLTEAQMTGTVAHVTGKWRYERLEGVGHWMQLEAPSRVNALLFDFLASAPR